MRGALLADGRRDSASTAGANPTGRGTRLLIAIAVIAGVWAGGIKPAHAASTTPTKTQGSQLEARAAFAPLVAIMVCTRLCPAAGVAAAKIVRRTPKQIKPIRAPNPAVAKSFSDAAGSSASRALGNAMAKSAQRAAALRAQRFNAHHIVAVKEPRAEFARQVLASRGIQPNSAANGVWLHQSVHTGIHTNAYYANVNAVAGKYYFQSWRPTSDLVDDLARIGKLLQKGLLPL